MGWLSVAHGTCGGHLGMWSSPQSAQWQYVHMDAAFVTGTAQQLVRMLHEIVLRRGEDDSLLFEEYWRLNNG